MKTAVEYTQYLNPMLRPTIVFAKESNSVFISFDFFMGGGHILNRLYWSAYASYSKMK